MFAIKFPTKRIFPNFHILKINTMMSFCNLFMERPLYFRRLCGYMWETIQDRPQLLWNSNRNTYALYRDISDDLQFHSFVIFDI